MVHGDWNGDGKQDLAILNSGIVILASESQLPPLDEDRVSILLGQGNGQFTVSEVHLGTSMLLGIAAGDFTGSSALDLTIASYGGGISILEGNGSGGFTVSAGAGFQAGNVTTAYPSGEPIFPARAAPLILPVHM